MKSRHAVSNRQHQPIGESTFLKTVQKSASGPLRCKRDVPVHMSPSQFLANVLDAVVNGVGDGFTDFLKKRASVH